VSGPRVGMKGVHNTVWCSLEADFASMVKVAPSQKRSPTYREAFLNPCIRTTRIAPLAMMYSMLLPPAHFAFLLGLCFFTTARLKYFSAAHSSFGQYMQCN